MNESKKLLAALVAVPASVVVADAALAAENETTVTQTFEIKNDFIGNTSYPTYTSSKTFTLNTQADLEAQIHYEMANFTKGFTITYSGTDVAKYKETITNNLTNIKGNLNQTISVQPASADTVTVIDTTELYGTFNNMRVKATETLVNGVITAVKLEFSVNYFGTKDGLTRAKENHAITTPLTNPLQTIKKVHDYVIKNAHYATNNHNLATMLSSGGSSHAYALWTYVLLKKVDPTINIEYVYGIANGEYRSWNIVKIGNEWYNLDVAGNDSTVKDNQTINYRYFLTYTENERRITSTSSTASTLETYNHFKTIDNLAQSADSLYYADAESNGEIKKYELSMLNNPTVVVDKEKASTGVGRMVYYKQTSGDTANVIGEYLYFINDSQGKYLYRYNLNNIEEPTLLVKEQIASITLSGSTLAYVTKDGRKDFLPLDNLIDLDKEIADKVTAAIYAIDPTNAKFKEDVKNARIFYMALTKEQKVHVASTTLSKLQNHEKELGKTTQSRDIIDKINALDELDLDYIKKVEEARKGYDSFSDKKTIYNASILSAAIAKIEQAQALSDALKIRIEDLADKEDKNLFNQYGDFIPFIENLLKEYDGLLPSIRKVFTNTVEFADYRITAATLRQEAQNFINEVKIIDENSESFFNSMASLMNLQNNFVKSQTELIRSEAAVVTQKISLYESMKLEVANFKQTMSVVTAANVGAIKLSSELIAKMNAAKQQFDKMKPAQQLELATEKGLLDTILGRIANLTSNTKLTDLETMLSTLAITNIATLDGITNAITSADTAVGAIAEDTSLSDAEVFALLSAKANENYQLFIRLNGLVTDATTLQSEMAALTNTSTSAEVTDLRARYDALEPLLKKFFTAKLADLTAQEQRLVSETNQATVAKLIADIALLTETSPLETIVTVKDRYDALTSALQSTVTNSAHLLAIWAKVEAEAKAYQKAIDDVNKAIEALSETSTRAEIEAVDAKYGALNDDQKSKVINYDKIATLLAALELKEGAELDQQAAQKVIEMIATLTDESSREEIEAIRAAYEALSDEANALIPNSTLEILAYFESRLAEISETAKKEAAVVVDRINRITNSYTEAQIKNIRIAYNALSALAKTYITNLQKLINAENNIIYQNTVVKQAKLDANAFDVYMNDINRNSTTAEIAKARAYYNRLSGEAKKHVTTYEKLVRLETMWKDPEYLDLVFTYYPEYIHAVKPGAIVVQKPTYDPLYIPDDSATTPTPTYPSSSVATNPVASWSAYETMRYQNGRYTTTISSTQVKNIADRNMRLKADNIEIVIPTADLKASTATVGVSVNVSNDQLNIQFTEGNNAKYFSDYVEIHVPFSALKGNASQIIERVSAFGSAASFKVDGSTFIIRTKSSGTFRTATATTYNDIPSGEQGTAIRELAKRGIQFDTTSRLSQSYKQVTKMDVALMIATALDLSSNTKSKYLDLESDLHVKRAQGLLEAGIMSGATSARFNPNGTITKQEAAIIIANMYRYLNQDLAKAYNNLNSSYSDIANLTLEARQSIAILELFGVVSGTGSFEPTEQLTRGEFAELLYKALTAIDYL